MIRAYSKDFIREIIYILLIILAFLAVRVFLFEISFVPTGSMKFSILPGDCIVHTKYNYGYSNNSLPFEPKIFKSRIFSQNPKRGDIITMKIKNFNDKIVKRLIALPGEKIEIKNNVTYINDKAITRKFIKSITDESGEIYNEFQETLPNNVIFYSYNIDTKQEAFYSTSANFGPFTVPQGHYFFLGDNRDESADSRSLLGFVPFESFVGKARAVVFSNKIVIKRESDTMLQAISRIPLWLQSFRFQRFFTSLYKLDVAK